MIDVTTRSVTAPLPLNAKLARSLGQVRIGHLVRTRESSSNTSLEIEFAYDIVVDSPAQTSAVGDPMKQLGKPDHLRQVAFDGSSSLKLTFGDGKQYSLEITKLGMPVDRIIWKTAKCIANAMTVKETNGDSIPIDSAALRYLVDPKYAAEIDKSIKELHMSPIEADEASRLSQLTRDPRWKDVGDEDDLFE